MMPWISKLTGRHRSIWKLQKETTFRSRVARRIFGLFILCGLLPVCLLAVIAYSQVTEVLREQADRELRRSTKNTAMVLIEKLSLLETDLRGLLASGGTEEGTVLLRDPDVRSRLASRFLGVALLEDGEDASRPLWGSTIASFDSSLLNRTQLARGRSVMRTVASATPGERPHVLIIVGLEGAQRFIVGEIDPRFLASVESLVGASTHRFCLDADGEALFATTPEVTDQQMADLVVSGEDAGRIALEIEGERWQGRYWTAFMKYQFDTEWVFMEARRESEVLAPVAGFHLSFLLACALAGLVVVYLSLTQIRRQLVPIEALRDATRRVAMEDFRHRVAIRSGDEFEELGDAFNRMAGALDELHEVRRALVDLGIALVNEKHSAGSADLLVRGLQRVLRCRAAAAVLWDEDGAPVYFTFVSEEGREDAHGTRAGGRLGAEDIRRCGLDEALAFFRTRRSIEDLSAEDPSDSEAAGVRAAVDRLPERVGEGCRSLLALPFVDHLGDVIGTLIAFDPARSVLGDDGAGRDRPFLSPAQHRLAELVASMAGGSVTQSKLLESFKQLFEGMTQLIATAIDEKSPYTYGHCQRVPILTMMIADAVSAATDGPYAEVSFTEDERYELQIAALLHDCGKVATPVHVVDKATKLETIFDRIELVTTRSEIVRRDQRIARLEADLVRLRDDVSTDVDRGRAGRDAADTIGMDSTPDGPLRRDSTSTEGAGSHEAAAARGNAVSGEGVAPREKAAPGEAVDSRENNVSRWSAGSRQEEGATTFDPEMDLDAALEFIRRFNTGGEFMAPEDQERVRRIADRFNWTDAAGSQRPLLTDDEVVNLQISRGTLNAEEREIIQGHMTSTIRMLEQLPYPRNLRRVPLIAGAHHERMDGTGYPQGLKMGDLPLQARILGLSDVFEALTAKDRPYKDGKKLSEVLAIMARMKSTGHLDPELFDFFVSEGVYMDYCREYVRPEQLDEFDLQSIPGCEGLGRGRRKAA